MRKNILLVSFVSAFLLTQTACEDGKDEFLDDFSTILYFRNSGEIPVSVYNTGEDANYQVVINKGGSELNAVTEVSIGTMDDAALAIYNAEQGVKYKAIPTTCYELNGDRKFTFAANELYKTMDITLKTELIDGLPALNTGEEYVLPLQLENSQDSINSKLGKVFIKPNVQTPTVFFSKSGYTQNFFSDNGPIKMNFTLPLEIPIPSKWDFSCELTIDSKLLDEYNAANECDYTGLSYGNYVLPICLSSCTKPQFVIDTERNTSLYAISYVPDASKLTKVNLKENMIGIFPDPTNEGSIAEMLDGKEDTYYHSNWSGVAPMPHWIQITLPKESTAVSIGYQVRHNNNNGAPLQYTLLGSLNGTDFSKITTVTENLPTATKAKYTSPVFVGKPFKYLRVQVDKTSVGNSFAFAEFWMSTD